MAIMLKKLHAELIYTSTGQDTVDQCRAHQDTDIIMMDINMDGYEASRKIRTFNQQVYIIGQTAYALEGDEAKALETGANSYIAKPVQQQALFEAIDKAI